MREAQQTEVEGAIRRMAGLEDYPTFAVEAEQELVRVGMRAKSIDDLQAIIDDIMDAATVATKCPRPGDILGALRRRPTTRARDTSCEVCRGSGWRIVEKDDGISGAERCGCGAVPASALDGWQPEAKR